MRSHGSVTLRTDRLPDGRPIDWHTVERWDLDRGRLDLSSKLLLVLQPSRFIEVRRAVFTRVRIERRWFVDISDPLDVARDARTLCWLNSPWVLWWLPVSRLERCHRRLLLAAGDWLGRRGRLVADGSLLTWGRVLRVCWRAEPPTPPRPVAPPGPLPATFGEVQDLVDKVAKAIDDIAARRKGT